MTVLPHQQATAPDRDDDAPGYQRVPPFDIDAERSVLGSMMMSKTAAADCQDTVSVEDYYVGHHQTIHQTILDRLAKGEPTDPINLAAELVRRGQLDRVGGAPYLHTLVQSVDTPANGSWHAEIVHEKAVLRRVIEAGIRITQSGYAGEGDIDEIVAAAAAEVAAVVEGTGKEDDFVTPFESLEATLDAIEKAQNGGGLAGLATGFTDLDNLTHGLQPGQVIVIAGRPGMGKSTLAMDMVRACAIKQNVPAAFISLEMPKEELNMRLLSAEARVGLHHMRSGSMSDEDWTKLGRKVPEVSAAPIYVNDCAQNFDAIQSKLRRLKTRCPSLGLVVLDYLQLITLGGKRPDIREREVAEISRKTKLLAKELNLPIIALSQLNRGPEQRTDKKPVVSDLRESGSIEQDADIIILLHREDAYEKETPRAGEADLIVGKHRNGSTATITVAFQGHYSRFVDMAQS